MELIYSMGAFYYTSFSNHELPDENWQCDYCCVTNTTGQNCNRCGAPKPKPKTKLIKIDEVNEQGKDSTKPLDDFEKALSKRIWEL